MLTAILLGALVGWPSSEAETPKVCAASIVNEGIFGGYHAYLLESGDLWIRDIYPPGGKPLHERRYRIQADRLQQWDLGRRVAAYEFLRLRDSRRREMPDEGRATISVSLCGERPFVVTQFLRDAAPSFWVVLDWFLIQMERAKREAPVYEGLVTPQWQPPGSE